MKISLINSHRDTKPRVQQIDWSGLQALLGTSRNLGVDFPTFKALSNDERKARKDGPAWIPGESSGGRTDDSVKQVEALVLDFDALYVTDEARMFERFSSQNYIAHTSASHTAEHPKWRVVLALGRPVASELWKSKWQAALSHFSLTGRLAPDRVAKNTSRLYYLPSHLDGVEPGFRCNEGRDLDMMALKVPPPPKPRRAPAVTWDSSDFARQARNYVRKIHPAIEGAGGDDATYRVACALIRDFALPFPSAMDVFREWNQRCVPPWCDEALEAKLKHAERYGKNEFGCRRSAFRDGGIDAAAARAFIKSFVGSKA